MEIFIYLKCNCVDESEDLKNRRSALKCTLNSPRKGALHALDSTPAAINQSCVPRRTASITPIIICT